jgi:hypothetical protein
MRAEIAYLYVFFIKRDVKWGSYEIFEKWWQE